jgi:hypothetical protein
MPGTHVTEVTDYAQQLVDKSLSIGETAQASTLNVFRKAVETLEGVAPSAQTALAKVDVADVRQVVDHAFATAERVLQQQQNYVGELLGSLFAAPAKPKAAKGA